MESPQLTEAEIDNERGLSRLQLTMLIVGACIIALILLNALSSATAPPSESGRIDAHPVLWQLFLIFGTALARPFPILTFGIMFAFTAFIANRMRALSVAIAVVCVLQFILALMLPVAFNRFGVVHTSTFPDSSVASFVSFYGFGAIALLRRNVLRSKLVMVCAVVLALSLYAAARLYFGIASPTDILGGVILGLTLGAVAYLLLERSRPAAL